MIDNEVATKRITGKFTKGSGGILQEELVSLQCIPLQETRKYRCALKTKHQPSSLFCNVIPDP